MGGVTNRAGMQLRSRLEDVLGPEHADHLMTHPYSWPMELTITDMDRPEARSE